MGARGGLNYLALKAQHTDVALALQGDLNNQMSFFVKNIDVSKY